MLRSGTSIRLLAYWAMAKTAAISNPLAPAKNKVSHKTAVIFMMVVIKIKEEKRIILKPTRLVT
jgi:hypothetical protein